MTTESVTVPPVPVSGVAAVGGLVMSVSAFLPLHPEGLSFFDLFLIELSRGLLEGVLMLAGFGSPYLLGLAILIAPILSPKVGAQVLRVPVALMHSQLMLVAIVVASKGEGVAPYALLGFAAVSGIYLVMHTARTHAEASGPTAAWYARWGAMVVAGIAAWAELQRTGGVVLEYGLHALLGGSLLVVAALARAELRGPIDGRPQEPEPVEDDT